MNTNISSLQNIVSALEQNDYVTSVTPVTENGEVTGYTIFFTKSSPVTIYHGEKGDTGETGATPQIGVKKDTDGVYYWTLNGDYLRDSNGNKIPTTGEKGDKGDAGADAVAPQVRVNADTNYWEISTDGGVNWTSTSVQATGDKGDSFFQSVDYTSSSDYVVFTLSDGSVISLPRYAELSISFSETSGITCLPGKSVRISYIITGADDKTTIETVGDGGWKSRVEATDKESGSIVATAPDPMSDGKILVFVNKDNGQTIMKALNFVEGVFTVASDVFEVSYEAQTLDVKVLTDLGAFSVYIPEEASSWISEIATRSTVREETVSFSVSENPENEPKRSCNVEFRNEFSQTLYTVTIVQAYQPSSSAISFADEEVKAFLVEHYDTNGDGEISYKEAATVQSFGAYAFPKTITTFEECQYFTGLEEISEYCFQDCVRLTKIILPSNGNLKVIDYMAFRDCSSIEEIIIPESITIIGDFVFYGCSNLKEIVVPDGVHTIGSHAFYECENLKSVIFPSYLKRLGGGCFTGCEKLQKIDLSGTSITSFENGYVVISIGGGGFMYCTSLYDVSLPKSFTKICSDDFGHCSSLQSITIPENVSEIGQDAFAYCSALKSVYLKSKTAIVLVGEKQFYKTHSDLKIYVPTELVDSYKSASDWAPYADRIVGYDFVEE